MSDLVGNPEDRFSQNEAQIQLQRDFDSLSQRERVCISTMSKAMCYATLNQDGSIHRLKQHILEELYTSKYQSSLQQKKTPHQTDNENCGYLRRNLRIYSPDAKLYAYITLVRSHLEYSASICSPYTDQSKYTLEMV